MKEKIERFISISKYSQKFEKTYSENSVWSLT